MKYRIVKITDNEFIIQAECYSLTSGRGRGLEKSEPFWMNVDKENDPNKPNIESFESYKAAKECLDILYNPSEKPEIVFETQSHWICIFEAHKWK